MSKAPFSKPDVNDVVSSSHVFKIRSSLNHWSRRRLPDVRDKHLFGIVVIALLLLGSLLTACGSAATPNNGSASSTSNTTSPSNTLTSTSASTSGSGSTSASTSTTGPSTGPTTGPTTGPAPDKTSFTISVQGGTFCYSGIAGQSNVTTVDFPSPLDLIYNDSAKPAPGRINWSISALASAQAKKGVSCSDPSPCTILGGDWLSFHPSSGSIDYGSRKTVTLQVSHAASMPAGVYCKKIQVYPINSNKNYAYAELRVVVLSVSNISPATGPAAGGTTVTLTGIGFTDATAVKFGSTVASNFTVDSDTQITATSPAGTGTVPVTVTTRDGTSAAGAAAQF